MSDGQRNLIATRGAQMFPRLTDDELDRLSRFGEPRSFRAGEMVAQIGEAGPGLMLILSGEVEVSPTGRRGLPIAHRHPSARQLHGRAGAAVGTAVCSSIRRH